MLHFSKWKVLGIVLVLVWGALLAFPNAVSDGFVGVKPDTPISQSAEDLAKFRAQQDAAEQSWWPNFLPKNKVNLGLDLQGGVYLLIEFEEEEVVANRMEIARRDVTEALGANGNRPLIASTREVNEDTGQLEIRLRNTAELSEAMRRLRDANPAVEGTLSGAKTFDIEDRGGGLIVTDMTGAAREALVSDSQGKIIEIIRRRIDPDGVKEISIQPQADNRIVLEAPGVDDPKTLTRPLEEAGRMTFNIVDNSPTALEAARNGLVRPGYKLVEDSDGFPYLINVSPIVTGSDIATANPGFDPDDNSRTVDFRLSGSGAKRFGDATVKYIDRQFAIVLDDLVMSAPVIREPIYGGSVQISGGGFTEERARELAAIIEAGELPAKLEVIQERTVTASLGEDSIRAGTAASVIGLVLVAVFMVLAYSRLGIFAVGSLMINIILILGALSGIGATLTLPGIAGIILTIGMAVDANVLVFERIREETRAGRGAMTAVQAGYEKALGTILDANITTFIAAAILYILGSGPVSGFAVTLAIGIVTSVFTAFVVTRWFTSIWLHWAKPKKLKL
jgi:protein-export membrane protein SecD